MLLARHIIGLSWLALALLAPAQVVVRDAPPPAAGVIIEVPRQPLPPSPWQTGDPGEPHRVSVKFVDALQARALADGRVSIIANEAPAPLQAVIATHNLRFRPLLAGPDAKLEALVLRARLRSGQAQPDLNGMHIVFEGDAATARAIANDLRGLPSIEWVRLLPVGSPPPPPVDLAPVTPDHEPDQLHRDPDPGYDVDRAFSVNALGAGIRLSDVEYGFNPAHEDLVDAGITDESSGTVHPSVYTLNYDDHGTAAIGVIAAPDNGYGVTGIAPAAEVFFYAEWLTSGWNRPAAVAAALADSGPGDIVLLEMQSPYGTPGGDFGPAELDPAVFNLVEAAVDSGIIVVAAAGNGALDLDQQPDMDFYNNRGDSGAIIVGAGSDSLAHTTDPTSCYGARVDLQAWGRSVVTTGYGTFASYGTDENQDYHYFGGTSAASASVAGAAAALQSYAVEKLGTRLDPEEMRELLVDTGHPPGSGGHIGPALDMGAAIDRINALAPIDITAIRRTGTIVEIDFRSDQGVSYSLEGSPGGTPGSWSALQSGMPGTGATATFTLDQPDDPDAYFFRVLAEVGTTP